MIDDTEHQGNTASPDDTAIHHEQEWLLGQTGEQALSNRQKPAVDAVGVVLEPAAEPGDQTFLVGAATGSMIGEGGEVRSLSTD